MGKLPIGAGIKGRPHDSGIEEVKSCSICYNSVERLIWKGRSVFRMAYSHFRMLQNFGKDYLLQEG